MFKSLSEKCPDKWSPWRYGGYEQHHNSPQPGSGRASRSMISGNSQPALSKAWGVLDALHDPTWPWGVCFVVVRGVGLLFPFTFASRKCRVRITAVSSKYPRTTATAAVRGPISSATCTFQRGTGRGQVHSGSAAADSPPQKKHETPTSKVDILLLDCHSTISGAAR